MSVIYVLKIDRISLGGGEREKRILFIECLPTKGIRITPNLLLIHGYVVKENHTGMDDDRCQEELLSRDRCKRQRDRKSRRIFRVYIMKTYNEPKSRPGSRGHVFGFRAISIMTRGIRSCGICMFFCIFFRFIRSRTNLY